MSEPHLDRELASHVLESPEQRAVYTDWLLEHGDPRGLVLTAARTLKEATSASGRSGARLELVAALKKLAGWLDEKVPEGRPWRSADTRGVTSDTVGFLSHEEGVLHRLRCAPGRDVPLPASLLTAVPTVSEVGIPAAAPARAGLSVLALHPVPVLQLLGPEAIARFACFDLELPASLSRLGRPGPDDERWRFRGFADALAKRSTPAELRLADGALEVDTFAALLGTCANASMLWLDRVRLPVEDVGPSRDGVVRHLRLVETPLEVPVANGLSRAGLFSGLQRLEVKDWPLGPPALEAMLRGAPALTHLSLIRVPLGADLVRLLTATGRLHGLESLDASGCLLGLGGVSRLLDQLGPRTSRLVLRFNQLTENDLASLARRNRWPSHCEVRFEEVTFGAGAHQAVAMVAQAHRLRMAVNGCVLVLAAST
ncbi:MAG: hypothetical protein JNJ54_08805 [Myxococcaceae bacterium]|nr:hypothetical protein [Myxococcaceae bacterium]